MLTVRLVYITFCVVVVCLASMLIDLPDPVRILPAEPEESSGHDLP